MDFEIVRPNVLANDVGANLYCLDTYCPPLNNTCNCGDTYCGNYNCSFVAAGEGCQEVSINTLTPQI